MAEALWTLAELIAATGGEHEGRAASGAAGASHDERASGMTPRSGDTPEPPFFIDQKTGSPEGVPPGGGGASPADRIAVNGISIDTRTIQPGDLFVALQDVRDGHEFVTAAFTAGAEAALVKRDYPRKPGDGALLRVDDPLAALESIGRAARARLAPDARVIAVTGSAGKTGTKEMLRACLATAGRVHASEKSYNNHWGVPLTLALMPADTQFGVFEIGMNHANEIRPLTKMVRPHVAIITNVLPVHVGNFADGEVGVAKAKAEIFEGLEPGGVAIMPRDGEHYEVLRRQALAAHATVRTFGVTESANARSRLALHGSVGERDERPGTDVRAEIDGRAVRYHLATPGQHIVTNTLAIALCFDSLGVLAEPTLAPLATIGPSQGRGQRTRFAATGGPVLLIDESYNANPASMQWAIVLANLEVEAPYRRGVAVLGDMLELGDRAAKFHAEAGRFIAEAMENIDTVHACGPLMKHLYDALPVDRRGAWTLTSAELIPHVTKDIRAGDVVMVKGSNGSKLALVVEAIKKHFAGP